MFTHTAFTVVHFLWRRTPGMQSGLSPPFGWQAEQAFLHVPLPDALLASSCRAVKARWLVLDMGDERLRALDEATAANFDMATAGALFDYRSLRLVDGMDN